MLLPAAPGAHLPLHQAALFQTGQAPGHSTLVHRQLDGQVLLPHVALPPQQVQDHAVQLLQAQKAIQQLQHDNHVIKGFTVQQCLDVALIALHNEFHFGPKMSTRFESAFLDTFMAYAQMCVDDAADDPEIVYTKEKMDRALRAACGENIRPFEERYAIENLYFREKLREKSHE